MATKNALRRGNNEGTVRQRSDGRWEALYIAGYQPDGKAIRRSIYGKSKKEVTTKLREVIQQIERDEYIAPQNITFAEWLTEWWNVYCLPSKKHSTCTGYESSINLHLLPYLGNRPLQGLRPEHVQAAINALVKDGKAPSTVRKAYTLLHAALDQAVINRMLLHNPSDHTICQSWNKSRSGSSLLTNKSDLWTRCLTAQRDGRCTSYSAQAFAQRN